MTTERVFRLAVVGLGAVVHHIHLPAYSRLHRRVKIVGGCDPNADARTEFTRKTGAPAFKNLGEMIASTRPDIVSICTPPALHLEHAREALATGCHVFCEKPLTENLADADALIAAARIAHRKVVVNSQFPAMKIYTAAKKAIGSPEFGRLLFLHASQTFRPTGKTEAGWRATMKRRVGFEFGVHVFELIRYFFDESPLRISATMTNPFPGQVSDAINIITVEFAAGRAASIMLDRASKGPERYLDIRLDGEHAAIVASIGGEFRFEAGLLARQRRPYARFSFAGGGMALLQNGDHSVLLAREGLNVFASATAIQLGCMMDVLSRGGECPGAIADHRKTLALTLAAYDAAEAGRTLELKPYLDAPFTE